MRLSLATGTECSPHALRVPPGMHSSTQDGEQLHMRLSSSAGAAEAYRAAGLAHCLVVGAGHDPEWGEHDLLVERAIAV